MYKRVKMVNYCLYDNTSDYMKKKYYNIYQNNLDKIKNRKNKFLPKINSQRSFIRSPKKRTPEEEKIEADNYVIFKNLISIDYRLPVLSEKKYLNQRYINILKKDRSEINRFQVDSINNTKKHINRKVSLSPIKSKKYKEKYDLYTEKSGYSKIMF